MATNDKSLVDSLYDQVLSHIRSKQIKVRDLVVIATKAMELVQKVPELTGSERKNIVIDVVVKIVDDSNLLSGEDEAAALMFIEMTLPTLIDTVVNAYKKHIDLKKIKTSCGCI